MSSKLNKCTGLDDMVWLFQQKVADIRRKVDLRGANDNPKTRVALKQVYAGVQELMVCLTLFRLEVQARRNSLNKFESLKENVSKLQTVVDHATKNLPTKLPQPMPLTTSEDTFKIPIERVGLPISPYSSESSHHQEPFVKKLSKKIPSLEYLTVHEFDAIPKYMKGRITYEKMNGAIDEINKAFSAKYKMFGLPRTQQTEYIKRQLAIYKTQETKDSKGLRYIVEADLKDNSNFKLDSTGGAVLTMLRHAGRFKEIRGGRLTRYAIKKPTEM